MISKTGKQMKTDDISLMDTKLYKLNAQKTKLRNCPTPALREDIEELMPQVIINRGGRIYFILIISCTFVDKVSCTFVDKDAPKISFGTTSWN
jgi:hypothetical protein